MTGERPDAPQATAHTHDVVLVGGGLVGLAAALALADRDFSVAVIDAAPPAAVVADTFDGRASAIAYANCRMLRRLGAGPDLDAVSQRIETIVVSDGRAGDGLRRGGPGPYWLRFSAAEIDPRPDGEPLGYMVANRDMRAALLAQVAAQARIEHIAPALADTVTFDARAGQVTLDGGRVLRAPLVVGAEGARSPTRQAMGVRTVGWPYKQNGIVATVSHAEPHHGVAHEYFLPSGPFAILPLTENRASLVWTERASAARAAVALSDADFEDEVVRRFGDFLGAVRVEGPRWTFPLELRVSERFVAARAALIGDAARRVHPIAGQGFNLGLKDAAALADVLADARAVGLDWGGLDVLERYQTWRRFDSLQLAAATDLFNRLYSTDAAPVRLVRSLGLSAVNQIGPLRRLFARDAGADTGDLPTLLRADA